MAETTTMETTTTMELTTDDATTAGITPGHYKTTEEATKAITDKPTKIVNTLKPGLLESESAPICTNDYMELALPAHRLSHVITSGLHWDLDPSCQATFNGTHYILRTGLYQCGTKVTFDSKYVIFYNNVSLLFTHDGVITRDPDVVIHSVCKYDRDEAVMSEFLPIPGGLEFVDEGFGQLSIRLDLFPTQSYLSPYTTPDYPVHLHLRDMMYLQLQVQGHARQLSVIALHCEATSGNNASLKYPLIQESCASDDTLQFYAQPQPGTQRFGLEAFRFVQEVTTVNIRCEVEVCDATDTTSRCEQGCRTSRHHKRALGDQDAMKSRYVISQGPIIFSADFQEADGAKAAVIAVGGSAVVIVLAAVLLAVRVRRSKRVHPGYQPLSNLDAE
ncbi:ZP domain-containing protein-like [Branchiostoma floridae]|nr:ZP domain-containing protein-like [Branchiostoma floridae]